MLTIAVTKLFRPEKLERGTKVHMTNLKTRDKNPKLDWEQVNVIGPGGTANPGP